MSFYNTGHGYIYSAIKTKVAKQQQIPKANKTIKLTQSLVHSSSRELLLTPFHSSTYFYLILFLLCIYWEFLLDIGQRIVDYQNSHHSFPVNVKWLVVVVALTMLYY